MCVATRDVRFGPKAAVVERELEELIRLLLDATIRTGRITAKGMNAKTRIQVATNLIQGHVYDSRLKPERLTEFIKIGTRLAETAQNKRDLLAHGLWDRRKGEWHVLRLSAARTVQSLQPNIKKLARSVVPQSEIVTRTTLSTIAKEIIAEAKAVEAFCNSLHGELAPLRHKPPQYSRRRRIQRAQGRRVPP